MGSPASSPDSKSLPTRHLLSRLVPHLLSHPHVTALVTALVVMALAIVLDEVLLGIKGWPSLGMISVSNLILAVIAYVLLQRLFAFARRERQQVAERLRTVAEMNHHIRGALQVISFNARSTAGNEWEFAEIKRAVDRIHWALREIVPRLEPEFKLFDSSTQGIGKTDSPPQQAKTGLAGDPSAGGKAPSDPGDNKAGS